ncbi:hypothetical protein Btru_037335 [Bulinus truncatus]|nr:hypothetical protein Btru_037335 [Bulinus truncatus]
MDVSVKLEEKESSIKLNKKSSAITVEQIQEDRITELASKNWSQEAKVNGVNFKTQVVDDIYHKECIGSNFSTKRIMMLEFSRYLENYLWPNYKKEKRRVYRDTYFNRTWQEYKHGFGAVCDDYWLGNENIYLLTSTGVLYQQGFSQYRLHLKNFTGNIYDNLNVHDGMKFSTPDRDNDLLPNHFCAAPNAYNTGWWYKGCHLVNLNGHFHMAGTYGASVIWKSITTDYNTLSSYSEFYIDSEADNYRLHLNKFKGNVYDFFIRHNDTMFSTPDRDNDFLPNHFCAGPNAYNTGWWFRNGHYVSLNGHFRKAGTFGASVIWESITTDYIIRCLQLK